tara:strand:- start:580 stop:822 length:243 start_codon:yes stop_codon:yes gene_type:complete
MQGAFVSGSRPKTKKAFKEAVKATPGKVRIEATSVFGNDYDGLVSEMPEGKQMYVVGPDPYTKRSWYANVTRNGAKITIG